MGSPGNWAEVDDVRIGTPKQLVGLAVTLLALAGGAEYQARQHEALAKEAAAQSQAAGSAFTKSFDGFHQDSELKLLDERRQLLIRSANWRRGAVLGLGFALLASFAAFVARELRVFREAVEASDTRPPSKAVSH